MVLRVCYAMPGSDVGYLLRKCSAMSGTDVLGDTTPGLEAYACAARCPITTSTGRKSLWYGGSGISYAISYTLCPYAIFYATIQRTSYALGSYAFPGTNAG
eukprot:412447-Rhodomonas_salina.6